MNKPLIHVHSQVVYYPVDHLDTDQIIPARFLKTTQKSGLGEHLFHDKRYSPDGSPNPEFVLNKKYDQVPEILLTGKNFGCGSSREHAPWALADYGIRVILADSFADIFRSNAQKNNILLITLSAEESGRIRGVFETNPQIYMDIDIASQRVQAGDLQFGFEIDPYTKTCLIEGLDNFGYLLKHLDKVVAYEKRNGKQNGL